MTPDVRGRTLVVKYGGAAMTDEAARAAFAADVALLHGAGARLVVVHGGGPQVTAHLGRLGIPTAFAGGRRVTTAEAVDVVRMVLIGQVNRDVVSAVNAHGPVAVGLSGEDLLTAAPLDPGLGQVGDVTAVDPALLDMLLAADRVPVVASVARGADGTVYNVNADTAAAAVAVALGAERAVFLTDVDGLYAAYPEPDSLVSSITAADLAELLPELADGMAPKMEACLRAVRGGVGVARVVDGRVPHALLADLRGEPAGTTVTP